MLSEFLPPKYWFGDPTGHPKLLHLETPCMQEKSPKNLWGTFVQFGEPFALLNGIIGNILDQFPESEGVFCKHSQNRWRYHSDVFVVFSLCYMMQLHARVSVFRVA